MVEGGHEVGRVEGMGGCGGGMAGAHGFVWWESLMSGRDVPATYGTGETCQSATTWWMGSSKIGCWRVVTFSDEGRVCLALDRRPVFIQSVARLLPTFVLLISDSCTISSAEVI